MCVGEVSVGNMANDYSSDDNQEINLSFTHSAFLAFDDPVPVDASLCRPLIRQAKSIEMSLSMSRKQVYHFPHYRSKAVVRENVVAQTRVVLALSKEAYARSFSYPWWYLYKHSKMAIASNYHTLTSPYRYKKKGGGLFWEGDNIYSNSGELRIIIKSTRSYLESLWGRIYRYE